MNHLCSYSKALLVSTTNFTQQKWRLRGVLLGLKMVLTQQSKKEFHGGKRAKAKSVLVPATRFQSISCEPTDGCRPHTTLSGWWKQNIMLASWKLNSVSETIVKSHQMQKQKPLFSFQIEHLPRPSHRRNEIISIAFWCTIQRRVEMEKIEWPSHHYP